MDYQKISVILIGNTTCAGTLYQPDGEGSTYGAFRLAVRNKNQETIYYPVVCFGTLGRQAPGICKGDRVFVEGELEIASAVEDGTRQMRFRVLANSLRILPSPLPPLPTHQGGRPSGSRQA